MGAKKILVLDVDETLLNIEPLFFLEKFKKDYKDYEGKLMFDKYYLSPRPKLKEFISKTQKYFDLVAFSVAYRDITIKKLNALGIADNFIKIYGKEDLIDKKKSLKKVSKDLNIDIGKIIAVDDNPEIFIEQTNVVKIKPWFIGDKEDNSLLNVFKDVLEFNTIKVSS